MASDDYSGEDFSGDDFGEDILGDDYAGEDVLGAARRYQRARARGRRGGRGRRPGGMLALGRPIHSPPGWRDAQQAPGVMAPTEQLLPLGFASADGSPTFINAGPTAKTFIARPQKPFRGERLVIDVARSAGAAATTPQLNSILVGTDLQIVSAQPIPLTVFGPTAFGVRLALTAAQPGIELSLSISLAGPALAPGESITVLPTVLGRAIL